MGIGQDLFRRTFAPRVRALRGIPGPTPSFPLGNATDFRGRQAWETCALYAREYGGLCVTWLFSTPVLVLNDAALIGEVLDTRRDQFYKKDPRQALLPIGTDNLVFIARGASWAEKRAADPFSQGWFTPWLSRQVDPFRRVVARHAERIRRESADSPVGLALALERMTFDAFAATILGADLGERGFRLFMKLAAVGDRRLKSFNPPVVPIAPSFYSARREWLATFEELIEARRRHPFENDHSLLGTLLREGTEESNEALPSVLANVFFGGAFSASSGLATTLHLLSHDRPEKERLRADLDRLEDDADLDSLQACARLDVVLRESLRLLTPVPIFFRNVLPSRPAELGGHLIPPDTMMFLSNWALHRSRHHWGDDAERFVPGRWTPEVVRDNPYGSGWFFPFGRGPRECIGRFFALAYMKTALAAILRSCRVTTDWPAPQRQGYFFGVMFLEGLTARFEAR